jgi:hypothetical protein
VPVLYLPKRVNSKVIPRRVPPYLLICHLLIRRQPAHILRIPYELTSQAPPYLPSSKISLFGGILKIIFRGRAIARSSGLLSTSPARPPYLLRHNLFGGTPINSYNIFFIFRLPYMHNKKQIKTHNTL